MIASVTILDSLLLQQDGWPLVDVRSPKEFHKGHIPTAVNVPLFSDEERHEIGYLYKQEGKEPAFLRGLEMVGPKMAGFVRKARQISPDGKLLVHCWRGGMRSQSMAWLWQQAGLTVQVIEGGYKQYRRYILQEMAQPLPLIVLGGKTGCGKTELLHGLVEAGEKIIDLEGLARHKGSAFGGIGQVAQPTVEQFENDLFAYLLTVKEAGRIWVENESHSIGRVYLPQGFWQQLQEAPVVVVEREEEDRLDRLVQEYAGFPEEALLTAVKRIRKRLGGKAYQDAIEALANKNYRSAAQLALRYYDKAYQHSLQKRPTQPTYSISLGETDLPQQVQHLIQYAETHLSPP